MPIVLKTEEERKLWCNVAMSVRHLGTDYADSLVLAYQKRLPLPEPASEELSGTAFRDLARELEGKCYVDDYDVDALEEFFKDLRKQWFKEWRESA